MEMEIFFAFKLISWLTRWVSMFSWPPNKFGKMDKSVKEMFLVFLSVKNVRLIGTGQDVIGCGHSLEEFVAFFVMGLK